MCWLTIFVLIVTLTKGAADICGNGCSSTQVCGNNGTCLELSRLKVCYRFFDRGHYCEKEQDCCSDGCIPRGSVCCRQSTRYCQSGHTCCLLLCCRPGTYCSGTTCVVGTKSTTKKPTQRPTIKPRTPIPRPTTKRFPTRTLSTRVRFRSSINSSVWQSWYYALIGTGVLVLFVVLIVVALVIRRRRMNALNAQYGNRGVVREAPAPIHGHTNRGVWTSSGVPRQTSSSHEHFNVAYHAK